MSRQWNHCADDEWPDRISEPLFGLVDAMYDFGAGNVVTKALDKKDQAIESCAVVQVDDDIVLGVWVDCKTGDVRFARLVES